MSEVVKSILFIGLSLGLMFFFGSIIAKILGVINILYSIAVISGSGSPVPSTAGIIILILIILSTIFAIGVSSIAKIKIIPCLAIVAFFMCAYDVASSPILSENVSHSPTLLSIILFVAGVGITILSAFFTEPMSSSPFPSNRVECVCNRPEACMDCSSKTTCEWA